MCNVNDVLALIIYLHLNEKGNDVVTDEVEKCLVKEIGMVKSGSEGQELLHRTSPFPQQ
jgi:hypothetical protein